MPERGPISWNNEENERGSPEKEAERRRNVFTVLCWFFNVYLSYSRCSCCPPHPSSSLSVIWSPQRLVSGIFLSDLLLWKFALSTSQISFPALGSQKKKIIFPSKFFTFAHLQLIPKFSPTQCGFLCCCCLNSFYVPRSLDLSPLKVAILFQPSLLHSI